MKKVLIISYEFPPIGGSGVQRVIKMVKYLNCYGYEPIIITSRPTFQIRDESLLAELKGVKHKIHHISDPGILITHKMCKMRLNYFAHFFYFPDFTMYWKKAAVEYTLKYFRKEKEETPIAVWATGPPWTALMAGVHIAKSLRIPIISDFRDPWCATNDTGHLTGLHRLLDYRAEEAIIRKSNAVVLVTPGLKEIYGQTYSSYKKNMHLIYNGYDETDIPDMSKSKDSKMFNLGFMGNFYQDHRDHNPLGKIARKIFAGSYCKEDRSTHRGYYIISAIADLLREEPSLRSKFRFTIVGNVTNKDNEDVIRHGLQDVILFEGYLSHQLALSKISNCDALFIPMMRTIVNGIATKSYNLSGKIFEYLALQKRIIAATPEGDLADLIRNLGAGEVLPPNDTKALKNLLRKWINDKLCGRYLQPDYSESQLQQFTRRFQAWQLSEILDHVIAPIKKRS